MPRFLVTVNEWGAASLPPAVAQALPTSMFIESCDDGSEAIDRMERDYGRGALIMNAVALPVGRQSDKQWGKVSEPDAPKYSRWCECEHVDHTTINAPKHEYGDAEGTVIVNTIMGRYRVCKACAEGCEGYNKPEQRVSEPTPRYTVERLKAALATYGSYAHDDMELSSFTLEKHDSLTGDMTYSAPHNIYDLVKIVLPNGYFGDGQPAPKAIVIPNFEVRAVRERSPQYGANVSRVMSGDDTPWGRAQGVTHRKVEGGTLSIVSTAGHGGIFVPPTLIARIPVEHQEYAARWSGSRNWYEEDCAALAVIAAFPEGFPDLNAEDALKQLGYWMDSSKKLDRTVVRERSPRYRVERDTRRDPVKYHRLPLHLAGFPDDITLCGEVLELIGQDNWTDDIEGVLAFEPVGCCPKCIQVALREMGREITRSVELARRVRKALEAA